MYRVEFDFKINEDVLNTYDWSKNILGLPKGKDGIVTFWRKIKKAPKTNIEFEEEIEDEETSEMFSDTEYFNSNITDDFISNICLTAKLSQGIWQEKLCSNRTLFL